MANKIKLAGTTSNNFQIGLQGVTIFSNRAASPYNLSLPANSGANNQVLISDGTGNINWSNSSINAGTVTSSSQPNITSVGTLTSLSVVGNANVGNIGSTNGIFTNVSGNGAALTSITGANVTGTVANATYATSAGSATTSTSATTAGTVTTAAQPNITSVGTLSSLSVSGTTNVSLYLTLGTNGSIIGGAGLPVTSGAGGVTRLISTGNVAYIQTGIYNTANSAAPLVFSTINAGREWMRLDTNGNLGINNTAPLQTLVVGGTANISGNANVGNIGAREGVFTGNILLGSGTGGTLSGVNLISTNNITTSNSLIATGNMTLAANLKQEGGTPLTANSTNITHKIPILINGVTYYIALTDAQ